MCFGGTNDTSNAIKQQQVERQQAIQQGMGSIDKAFSGFGPSYFSGVRQNALNTLLPQVENQYKGTQRSLVSAFGQKGILDGSAARLAGTELEKNRAFGLISVGNQANQTAQQAQRDVESQKQAVTNQLVVSQDPALAGQQAVSAAASIGAPSIVQPLGNLFQTFANTYLASQVGQMYPSGGGTTSSFGRGESATGKNYYLK